MKKVITNPRKKANSKKAVQSGFLMGANVVPEISVEEYKRMGEEVGVYQIELEMQNEELRQAKAQVEAEAKKYTELYNFAPSGYFTLDEVGDILEVNITGAHMLDNTPYRLIRNRFSSFISADTRHVFTHFFEALFNDSNKETCEVVLSRANNRPMHIMLVGILAENRTQCLLNAIDITKLKETEETVRQFSQAIEQSPVSIVITDTSGIVKYVNQKYIDITGFTAADVIGKTSKILNSEDSSSDANEQLLKTLLNGGVWQGEFLNRKKDGSLFWEYAAISPIRNEHGAVTHFLEIKEDVTAKKAAEEVVKKYAADLKNSNDELENFAFVASHDLQEPLRMINSFLNLLEKKMTSQFDDKSRQYIHFAIDGAERMKTLIHDLLMYSRVGHNHDGFGMTDLNEVLQYVTRQLLKDQVRVSGARIKINKLPLIMANRTMITELFFNLVSNAIKYNTDKIPTVEVGFSEEKDQYQFFVKDNGIGISSEYFDKIFVIFKRLHVKEEYSGTGIGLALCKKVIDLHHGKIWVESQPGKGSTFCFTIPKSIENIPV